MLVTSVYTIVINRDFTSECCVSAIGEEQGEQETEEKEIWKSIKRQWSNYRVSNLYCIILFIKSRNCLLLFCVIL